MSIVKLVTEERLPILLRSVGPEREAAAEELRELLVRAALAYLLRQHYPVEAFGADTYASIAEDYAQEAFTIILRQLNRFRGECRFTTWAYRIVINLIADEMRRRCWRRRPLPEDDGLDLHERTFGRENDVAAIADRRALWRTIDSVIQNELTPRQRAALIGRIFEDKPLIVLADELGTNKDNVYKLLHDARKHLKRALYSQGVTAMDALGSIDGRSV
ncbi:MAG TPA: sigma-70 family RNA polymerase sigma factor [Chloroflexota bacterium]|nr:sigma-70 family RNA polymerase sigma factor [Chloroflexota bacterium]